MKKSEVLLLAVCLLGCGGAGENGDTYQGKVTCNGSPLPAGVVKFMDAQGELDPAPIEAGAFTVQLKPGSKTVSVTAEKKIGERTVDRVPQPEPIMHQYLPEEFNTKTKLSQEIQGPGEPIVLDLHGTEVPAPANTDARPPPGASEVARWRAQGRQATR